MRLPFVVSKWSAARGSMNSFWHVVLSSSLRSKRIRSPFWMTTSSVAAGTALPRQLPGSLQAPPPVPLLLISAAFVEPQRHRDTEKRRREYNKRERERGRKNNDVWLTTPREKHSQRLGLPHTASDEASLTKLILPLWFSLHFL